MADIDTSTQAAPAAPAGGDVAPSTGGAAPAAGQAPTWSLDSWKEDRWDDLPERIRNAADARYKGQYEPKLTEAQTAMAAARKEAQDAKDRLVRGDPIAHERYQQAQAELARLKAEFDAHKGQFGPEKFDAYKAGLQAEWKKAQDAANKLYSEQVDAATMREIRMLAPWFGEKHGDAANPNYDADRTKIATDLDGLLLDAGLDLPVSFALQASGLNAAQRNALVTAIANDVDPMTALKEASKPPRHEPSVASRAAPGGPPRAEPRPDDGVRPQSAFDAARKLARTAASDAFKRRDLNADT